MTTADRAMPLLHTDERTTLASWLGLYQAALPTKCAGLTDQQLRTAPLSRPR